MSSRIAQLFASIAALGFAASAAIHVCAWFGYVQAGATIWAGLILGLGVVWIPTIRVQKQVNKDAKRTDATANTRGAPRWMTRCLNALWIYMVIHFFAVAALYEVSEPGYEVPEPVNTRLSSGMMLIFYATALVLLTSFATVYSRGPGACPNGHVVSPFAKSCEDCGASLSPKRPA